MTCIAGITHNGVVHISGDSAGVAGLDMRIRRDSKVFTNGQFVFGCTTSFRMIQLLRYALTVPKRHPDMDVMTFMTTTFIDSVRATLKSGGFCNINNNVESGGTFLVGHAGRLFAVYSDFQVEETNDLFNACGCGETYALASLFSTSGSTLTPTERLTAALECAAHFSAGVIGPFVHEQGGAA